MKKLSVKVYPVCLIILSMLLHFSSFASTILEAPGSSTSCRSSVPRNSCNVISERNVVHLNYSLSGSRLNVKLEKCSGSFGSNGTFELREGSICGRAVVRKSYRRGARSISRSVNVKPNTTYYGVAVSSNRMKYYAGKVRIGGASNGGGSNGGGSSNGNNNSNTGKVDLMFSGSVKAQYVVSQGQSVTVTGKVKNSSRQSSQRTTITIYYSQNTNRNSLRKIGQVRLSGLSGNRTKNFGTTVTIPRNAQQGRGYLWAAIDPGANGESKKDNNLSYTKINVKKKVTHSPPKPKAFRATSINSYTTNNRYTQGSNPFAKKHSRQNLEGQCTWYAYGRVIELVAAGQLPRGYETALSRGLWSGGGRHGGAWPSKVKTGGRWKSANQLSNSDKKPGMLVSWSGTSWGHIAFVEKVDLANNRCYISEFNIRSLKYSERWVSFSNPKHTGDSRLKNAKFFVFNP